MGDLGGVVKAAFARADRRARVAGDGHGGKGKHRDAGEQPRGARSGRTRRPRRAHGQVKAVNLSTVDRLSRAGGRGQRPLCPFYSTGEFRQFFMSVPKEPGEAGTIEGAHQLDIFWRIYLPLSKPAMIAYGVITALSDWD